MKTSLRWMVRRDFPSVLEIDHDSFDVFWSEEDFLKQLRNRSVIGMVAVDRQEQIVGFMIYRLEKNGYEILRLAVAPDCRRQGVGIAMLDKMADKLSRNHRTRFYMSVPEDNLDAQLWLRDCGIKAIGIDEDKYLFEYRLLSPAEASC